MISVSSALALIDFSAGLEERESLAKQQIEGSVALYNILHKQKLAYLADEVGMGKTYVSLGTIAMMRKKQPNLRVLYLLPKNNVRDKWVKDYKSFVEHNYLHDDLIVRSLDRSPAAPYVICPTLESLIREAALGNNQDIFICTSALSFALGNDGDSIKISLKKLKSIYSGNTDAIELLLQSVECLDDDNGGELAELKKQCKQLWARAINRIMPKFDLIVVDEAHNFKRGMSSSDRNQNLATILGTLNQGEQELVALTNKVLLLSATPYEYDFSELDNQFKLFGEYALSEINNSAREALLPKYMVRRLNELEISGIKHTRNMYREEHRAGQLAQVEMNDGQKLFAALMQKRISEHLRENFAGKYQTGLLASFESYVPSTLTDKEHATFDGDDEERKEDAKDDSVIGQLINSYQQEFNHMPPHPKMDWVVKQLHEQIYTYGKKQLIFVRRVASVSELKRKFEEHYDNAFIGEYIQNDSFVREMHRYYLANKYNGLVDIDLASDEVEKTSEGECASDDFFAWFYRGRNGYIEKIIKVRNSSNNDGRWVTPHNFRQKVAQRSVMFELNWAKLLCQQSGKSYSNHHLRAYAEELEFVDTDTDDQKRFQVAQYCYLCCLIADTSTDDKLKQTATKLRKYLYHTNPPKISVTDREKLASALDSVTFFEQANDELHEIFPIWGEEDFTHAILNQQDSLKQDRAIHLREILRMVIGYICRVDHPWIDLYSIRGANNEQEAFVQMLKEQKQKEQKSEMAFSSYKILRSIAANIDLLIKLNFSDAYRKDHGDLMRYISGQIRNLQSSAGASGINSGDRSPLARRFRMPGYPMVLISTDVFQEGEDLHTFCDAVSHYGLSASPIALEQKVGRVDRIGSLAQRNISLNCTNASEYFIQVRYPHIRESVEYIQVQQSASNLNQFIKNLHKINNDRQVLATDVSIDEQLSAIEPQITDYLESPFVADKHFSQECHFERLHSQTHLESLKRLQSNIEDAYLKGERFGVTSKGISATYGHDEFELRAARKSNELVLSATREALLNEDFGETDLLDDLKTFSNCHMCRLQAKHDKAKLRYYRNVERLFAIEQVEFPYTHQSIEREMEASAANFESVDLSESLAEERTNFLENHPELRLKLKPNEIVFGFEGSQRSQTVYTQQTDEYLCFYTLAISPIKLMNKVAPHGELDQEMLLKYTAERNTIYDLVDFYVNSDEGISVRAFLCKSESTLEDWLRTAYRVAREGDRLEYLFSDEDNY